MYDFVRVHNHKSIYDLSDDNPSLVLGNAFLLIDFSLEGLSITVFDNQDLEIIILEHIIAFKKERTVTHVHELRLRLSQPQLDSFDYRVLLVLYFTHVYELDCNLLFCVVIHTSIDTTIGAYSY